MPRKQNNDQEFIQKLHRYISNPSYDFIEWANDGKGFIVSDERTFTLQILEKKFNMGRFDSFIRKLNKFGFKRLKMSRSKIKFFHKEFTRDQKSALNIKKLTKQEALPKHIKLRMMRKKLCCDSMVQEDEEKEEKGGKGGDLKKERDLGKERRSGEEYLKSDGKQDIDVYLVKQI